MNENEVFRRVYNNLDEFIATRKKCNDCCSGKCKSFHCPLCPVTRFKPAKECKIISHMRVHWKTRIAVAEERFVVRCHLEHTETKSRRGHVHCPFCGKTIVRKGAAGQHVDKCCHRSSNVKEVHNRDVVCQESDATKNIRVTNSDNLSEVESHYEHNYSVHNDKRSLLTSKYKQTLAESPCRTSNIPVSNRKKCQQCNKLVSKKWFKSHINLHSKPTTDINQNRHHHTVNIDKNKGIYVSSKNLRGPFSPVHLKKITTGLDAGIFCENLQCIQAQEAAARGKNLSFECSHARSTPYAKVSVHTILTELSLNEMVRAKIITSEKSLAVQQLKEEAESERSPLVVFIPLSETSTSNTIYWSVYSKHIRYWSRLKRTVVSYSKTDNTIRCSCCRVKRTCLHKIVARWYLFQEMPELLSSSKDDECDNGEYINLKIENCDDLSSNDDNNDKTLAYMLQYKKYPAVIDMSEILEPAEKIIPSETICLSCTSTLSQPNLVTRNGKIVMKNRMIKDIFVYNKTCLKCGMIYRYQEWSNGIHNFNNSLFIGIDACHLIRAGLKNHVAISRTVSMLAETLGEDLPAYEMLVGYLMFECLSDHSYSFHCILCGYHPVTMIMDGIRKTCFRYEASKICSTLNDICETVNIQKFWNMVDKDILRKGVMNDLAAPLHIKPCYDNWAPWIGEKSRNTDAIYNTEYVKLSRGSEGSLEMEPVPDEVLKNLRDEKASTIRRFCRALGIRPVGSVLDLIVKLREHCIKQSDYDAAYEKIFGTSGGWVVGTCPHTVIYAAKCLLRGESPRDFVDLLKSMKHMPNVVIADMANKIASCGNRENANMFHPFEGRFAEATPENVTEANAGTRTWNISCLGNAVATSSDLIHQGYNPTSGSSDHYAFFDWFHEGNCNDPVEILRNSSLVQGLAGIIDTQAAEQFFNSLKRDLYFLNQMSAAFHVFSFRLLLQFHNEDVNKELYMQQQRATSLNLSFNELGQIYHDMDISGVQTLFSEENTTVIENLIQATDTQEFITFPEPIYYASRVSTRPHNIIEVVPVENNALLSAFNRKVDEFLGVTDSIDGNDLLQLNNNIRYATTTLYKRPDHTRLLQVKANWLNGVYMQTQGGSNYCGLCVVNNIIGPNINGEFIVTADEMDRAADEMWLNLALDPTVVISTEIPVLRDIEGFYSMEVLTAILEQRGYSVVRLNPTIVDNIENEELLSSLTEFVQDSATFILRYRNSAHWVAIKNINGLLYLLDSKTPSAKELTSSQLCILIRSNCTHPGAVYLVQIPDVRAGSAQTNFQKHHETADSDVIDLSLLLDKEEELFNINVAKEDVIEDTMAVDSGNQHDFSETYVIDEDIVPPSLDKEETFYNVRAEKDVLQNTTPIGSDNQNDSTDIDTSLPPLLHKEWKIYNLRGERKEKKRSSFIFPSFEAGKRRYCVCKRKNDGNTYWQCEKCERWYHPKCLGYSDSDEPDVFECFDCKKAHMECDDMPRLTKECSLTGPEVPILPSEGFSVNNNSSAKELDSNIHSGIPEDFCLSKIPVVLEYLYSMMACDDDDCDLEEHWRHHEFLLSPLIVYNRERRTHCFGSARFSKKIYEQIMETLMKELIYSYRNPRRPYTVGAVLKIRNLADCKLQKVFDNHKFLASIYVISVCLKESLIWILCRYKGCPYVAADNALSESEVHMDSLVKTRKL